MADWPYGQLVAASTRIAIFDTPAKIGMAVVLFTACEQDGTTDASIRTLAERAGCKPDTFRAFRDTLAATVVRLEDTGEVVPALEVERRPGKPSLTRVNARALLALDPRSRVRHTVEPHPREGYPSRGLPLERVTPREGQHPTPSGGNTPPSRGVGDISRSRVRKPSSSPYLALEDPAAAEGVIQSARPHAREGGGGDFSPRGNVRPHVLPEQVADADPLERKIDSLRVLFQTKSGIDPNPGLESAFERWMAEGQPLALVRQALSEAVEERLTNLPPGGRLQRNSVTPRFVGAILARLRSERAQAAATAPMGPVIAPPEDSMVARIRRLRAEGKIKGPEAAHG